MLQIVLPVPIDYFAAGGNPNFLARSDMSERLGEVFAPVGMPDEERVQADGHDSSGLGAIFVEHVKLIANHAAKHLRALFEVQKGWNIVNLNRIRNLDHQARFDAHRVGLLIVDPIADVLDSAFGE